MLKWQVNDPNPEGNIHIWPIDDLIEHTLTGRDCVCGPKIKRIADRPTLVIHASLDGRELRESR